MVKALRRSGVDEEVSLGQGVWTDENPNWKLPWEDPLKSFS